MNASWWSVVVGGVVVVEREKRSAKVITRRLSRGCAAIGISCIRYTPRLHSGPATCPPTNHIPWFADTGHGIERANRSVLNYKHSWARLKTPIFFPIVAILAWLCVENHHGGPNLSQVQPGPRYMGGGWRWVVQTRCKRNLAMRRG